MEISVAAAVVVVSVLDRLAGGASCRKLLLVSLSGCCFSAVAASLIGSSEGRLTPLWRRSLLESVVGVAFGVAFGAADLLLGVVVPLPALAALAGVPLFEALLLWLVAGEALALAGVGVALALLFGVADERLFLSGRWSLCRSDAGKYCAICFFFR